MVAQWYSKAVHGQMSLVPFPLVEIGCFPSVSRFAFFFQSNNFVLLFFIILSFFVFQHKLLHLPTSHVGYVFQLLRNHMKKQYEMGYVSHVAALLRVMVSWTSLCARVLVLLVMSGESCPEKKSYIFLSMS